MVSSDGRFYLVGWVSGSSWALESARGVESSFFLTQRLEGAEAQMGLLCRVFASLRHGV
jgi:hypothetical protein